MVSYRINNNVNRFNRYQTGQMIRKHYYCGCFINYHALISFIIMSQNKFDIKETVNKNLETKQFPSFSNHRSLVGWCSMNYPKVLVNPIYVMKPDQKQREYDLEHLFQDKKPQERERFEFTKPFTNYNAQKIEGLKPSTLTLTTTKHETKAEIFEKNNKLAEEFSAVKPLGCILGPNKDNNFNRKIRQIGEVIYEPSYQSEQIRHLKKLPNTIITEQNLLEILNPKLEYLDLQNNSWISNNLMNKIGYFAPNLKELNLSSTEITDDVLIELSRSCENLIALDISKCKILTGEGIKKFLETNTELQKFSASHNSESITDDTLSPLQKHKNMKGLNLNFCPKVTSVILDYLPNEMKQLSIANTPDIKGDVLIKFLQSNYKTLSYFDLSFNSREDINNALMLKVGNCFKLETLILSGCDKITDEAISSLINGQKNKNKQPDGFPLMKVLKLNGLVNLSDSVHNLARKCTELEVLELNNLQKLTDLFLDYIKNHSSLKKLLINFTPNMTNEKLAEIRQANKNMTIIRNIIKMTDPKDDGLRMPLPPANLKKKKKKKKKK